jgi:hypothetical protein
MIFAFNFLAIISIAYISGLSADFVPDAKVKVYTYQTSLFLYNLILI